MRRRVEERDLQYFNGLILCALLRELGLGTETEVEEEDAEATVDATDAYDARVPAPAPTSGVHSESMDVTGPPRAMCAPVLRGQG